VTEAEAEKRRGNHIMTPSVVASWDRIHGWLATHAPKLLANLNAGATSTTLDEAERTFGFEMPLPWRELYLVHDGMNEEGNLGNLFCGMEFLDLSRVTSDHRERRILADEPLDLRVADPGIRTENLRNPRWVALACDGSGTTWLRVDMDPADGGRCGQVIFVDEAHYVGILLGSSIAEYLQSFAENLEQMQYFLDPDALDGGNEFLNCAPEIDVINWFRVPGWNYLKR
jgi:cell wall assembly regulator SMI1